MKKIVLFLMTIFLTTGTTLLAQEKKTINQQVFTKVGTSWKLQDENSGKLITLSDELTLVFKEAPSAREIKQLEQEFGIKLIRSNRLGYYDFQVQNKQKVLTTYEQLTRNSAIQEVFANSIGEYILTPNDPQYGSQWHLEQSNDADIDCEDAWDITTGDSTILVAVLDSGTDWTHEDLGLGSDTYQNIYLNSGEDAWSNPNNPATGNGIDDDGNGFVDDWKGWDFNNANNDSRGPFYHGTHVAGVIGAKTNNGTGISGIAGGNNSPGTGIMPIGVGDSAPSTAALDDAILYAMDNGARVIQLSLTVASTSAINTALQTAYTNGVFIVCSSGNGSSSSIGYPSSNPNVFSVGATTQSDAVATFSNQGTDLDLAGPGVDILSTQPGDIYDISSGTSFSSPIVSATVALMLAEDPSLSNTEIENILKCTADKVGGYNYNWNGSKPGHSKELGYGRVNTYQAVLAASTSDIYTRDTASDDGTEPSSGIMWTSPDIWVRHDDDGGLTHQNPEYKTSSPNWVYIRINSKDCSMVDDATVKLYFSKASTGLSWPLHWNNYYQPVGGTSVLHGDYVGSASVPVSSEGEVIVKIPWYPPNPDDFINSVHHFCLLSRIESATDPIGTEGTSVNANTMNNNNISWKNVSVYDLNEFDSNAPSVFIRNVEKENQHINLVFQVTKNDTEIPFRELGDFFIKPDRDLDKMFRESELKGIKQVDKQLYHITDTKAQINHIPAKEFETFSLQLYVEPRVELPEERSVTYDVIQTNERHKPVGGERFILKKGKTKKDSQKAVDANASIKVPFYSLVPNPTSGEVRILLDDTYTGISVNARSLIGQKAAEVYLEKGNELSFTLQGPKGVYYVTIVTAEGKSHVSKVIKE